MVEPPTKRQALDDESLAWAPPADALWSAGGAADGAPPLDFAPAVGATMSQAGSSAVRAEDMNTRATLSDLSTLIRNVQQERGLTTIFIASAGRIAAKTLEFQRGLTDEAFSLPSLQGCLPTWLSYEALKDHRMWCNPGPKGPEVEVRTWYEAANPKMEDLTGAPGDPESLILYRVMRFFNSLVESLIERCRVTTDVASSVLKGSRSYHASVVNALSRYLHCIAYMECLGQERGYLGMILSLRSEQAAALTPRITNNLIKNIGRREALAEAFLATKPDGEIAEKFEMFNRQPRMCQGIERRILDSRPICAAEDDWLRQPEEEPLPQPMSWYKEMSIRLEKFRQIEWQLLEAVPITLSENSESGPSEMPSAVEQLGLGHSGNSDDQRNESGNDVEGGDIRRGTVGMSDGAIGSGSGEVGFGTNNTQTLICSL